MKRTKKLSLNKETLRTLSSASLARAAGGWLVVSGHDTCVCPVIIVTGGGGKEVFEGNASIANLTCGDLPTHTFLGC